MVVYQPVGSFAVVGGEGSKERGALSWWGEDGAVVSIEFIR